MMLQAVSSIVGNGGQTAAQQDPEQPLQQVLITASY